MNIFNILQGWANSVKDKFDILEPEIKQKGEKRLLICNVCIMRTGNTCDPKKEIKHKTKDKMVKGCGCNLSAKALSDSDCPAGKW